MKTLSHHSLVLTVLNGLTTKHWRKVEDTYMRNRVKQGETGWLEMRLLPVDLTNGNVDYFVLHGLTNTNKIKVKTKTATISAYLMHGTSFLVCDVLYRGNVVASFDRRSLQPHESTLEGLKQKGIDWALNNGFTGYRLLK